MHPHLAPPLWPEPQPRPGRFAATIVRNSAELFEDPEAGAALRKCAVAMIGLPDDTGVSMNHGRAGARNGPSAFRSALAGYGVASPADEPDDRPAYPRVFDAGDVLVGRDFGETHDRVTEVVQHLVGRGFFPIGIGGGHDLTFPFVRAVANNAPLDGLYIDAHLDVRPEPGSGMPFRALIEGGLARHLHVVGLNPLANTREHMRYFTSHGGQMIARHEIATRVPEWVHAHDRSRGVFVSLDLDALDAAHAPGVSALNPCGLAPHEVEPVIAAAARCGTVRCFDIMELNPDHDADGRTARLAVHMFLTFLRGFAERRP
ncbi:MAG: arginase family protein [Phycisphaerales bacterium]